MQIWWKSIHNFFTYPADKPKMAKNTFFDLVTLTFHLDLSKTRHQWCMVPRRMPPRNKFMPTASPDWGMLIREGALIRRNRVDSNIPATMRRLPSRSCNIACCMTSQYCSMAGTAYSLCIRRKRLSDGHPRCANWPKSRSLVKLLPEVRAAALIRKSPAYTPLSAKRGWDSHL